MGIGGLLVLLASVGGEAAAQSAVLERAAWLAGCWRNDNAEAGSGEQWLPLAGKTLMGISRTVRRDETVAHEFMQIRLDGEGQVVFVALPAGRAETSFTLQPGGPAELVFENPSHDFPQRVVYRLAGGGQLRARIEGQRNGQLRGVDFAFTRVPCDVQPQLPEAFQGLPWGASEAQMTMRFGASLKPADCQHPPRAGESCRHLLLERYDVAGVPFRLQLHGDDKAQQLVRVSLHHSGDAAAVGGTSAPESGWAEKHRLLRQLLTRRYGSPEATHVSNEPEAWQATARWRRGDTLIELTSIFAPRGGNRPAREQVEIVYQPSAAGDAGKL